MTSTFDIVAEPTRRRILDALRERPRSVGELVSLTGLSQPGVSKHLRVLREGGLVRVRPDAQQRWYELRPAPLAELDDWLTPYRELWGERLDALERHLDTTSHLQRKDRCMRSDTNSRLGEISTADDGTVTLRFERHLAHPPERIWAALTESAQLAQWFMAGTLEPRRGGRLRLDSGEEGGTQGEVLAWDPPRLLTYSWVRDGGAGARSVVHWELHPDSAGDSTLLVLEHRGVDRDTAIDLGAGWHDFLDRLPHHLDGEDTKDWTGHYKELLVQYRALA